MSDPCNVNEDTDIDSKALDHSEVDTYFEDAPPDSCSDTATRRSDYHVHLQTAAEDGASEAHDEINTEKDWWLNSHWETVPEPLIDQDKCRTYDETFVRTVEYTIEHASGDDDTVATYEFKDPVPDGKSGATYTDELYGFLLTMGGAATGNPYVAAGAGYFTGWIPDGGYEVVDRGWRSDDQVRQSWHWEVAVDCDNRSEFPQDPCDSTGARVTIQNKSGPGATHDTWTANRYNIYIPGHATHCPCIDDLLYKTTWQVWSYNEWESI